MQRPPESKLLGLAQKTPSWCNIQPWRVQLVSGGTRDRLSDALLEAAVGFALYASLNIERGDRRRRQAQSLENFRFFGAPHAAIITTDERLGTYGAVDCGGYVTSLLLAAESLGIAAVPQAAVAMYPDIIRREVGLGTDQKVVCGIALGYEETDHPANSFRTTRADIADVVTWLS